MGEAERTGGDAAEARNFDAIVVGAGFAGMYMLYRLRQMGWRAVAIEAGSDVGGTWYWNRYPGARCDGESLFYSYSFSPELEQEWTWSERYATQPEILAYARHVADRFDLRRDITFDTKVTSALFDESSRLWRVATDKGDTLSAPFCVMATGCLSTTNLPAIAGIESFDGPILHTGRWPHEPTDLSGKRVAVIGTGSSAMQSIPLIATQAAHLTVFQRTASYAVPAWNKPLDADTVQSIKADYPALREQQRWTFSHNFFDPGSKRTCEATPAEQQAEYERRWQIGGLGFLSAFTDVQFDDAANAVAADFVRAKIRAAVRDPKVAELLTPRIIIGCKRLCVVSDYYETFNRENVTLVDIAKHGIDRITPSAVVANGESHPADVLVLATGFDAMTGTLLRMEIATSTGGSLREKWSDGPICYLGLAMAGLPNLFIITGPGSPSVFTNMIPTIEHHVDFIADALAHMKARGLTRVEADADAEADWVQTVADVAEPSLRPSCNSWYVGANIPGKPRVFMPYMGGVPAYRRVCADVVAKGYQGFKLS
jgi:cation diffusion facilitator CzcD-associated flavoprotein CzcO